MLRELAQSHRVDALLAPIGLLAAIAAAGAPAAALLVLPLVSLLAVFARERDARIAHSIELGRAYRGTALLLCDLLEEDDEYTGHHTQDVVELSVRVAERTDVSEDVRRECELGAMLHDIGKISIPDAIINKPGPLDDAEWALMKTHTVEGQRMLDRVGGLLGSVGLVVRASHERFDGGGYPDGLAGEAIPLASRIVSACDAFNAMTTTRSYRKAMPVAAAVDRAPPLRGHPVRSGRGHGARRARGRVARFRPDSVLAAVRVGQELRQRRQERCLELLRDRDGHAGHVHVVAVRVRVGRDGRPGEHEERGQREVVEPDELLGVDAGGVEELAQGGVVLGVALRDVGELLHTRSV